jgi:pimeloyl-ACP methyl ester carboxylesterase
MLGARLERFATDLAGWIDENTGPFAPGASPPVLRWLGEMVMESSLRSLIDFQRAIFETDLTADAAQLDLPVTIIHGDQDVSAPIDLTARRYAEIMGDAELLVYEGVAHGVMVTHAERLAKDIGKRIGTQGYPVVGKTASSALSARSPIMMGP